MGYKRTGGKNGAPFGNKNRLTHGRYARATRAKRNEALARYKDLLLLDAMSLVVSRIQTALREGRPVPPEAFALGLGGRRETPRLTPEATRRTDDGG